jgi:hypothetical protein
LIVRDLSPPEAQGQRDNKGGEIMSDHRTDQPSPAQIRAARTVTADGRAPAAWKQAARTLGRPALGKYRLTDLLRAKGWHPVWGRYLLTHQDSRLSALPRESRRP